MKNNTLSRVIQVFGLMLAMVLMSAVHAVTVTMTVPDCPSGQALTFANNNLSCTGNAVLTPGACNITSNPVAATQSGVGVLPGTSVTLTAFCATGTTPISYVWGSNLNGSTQASVTINAPAAQTTYSVTPSNSAGPGGTFQTTVYIANTNPGTAPSNCSISQSPNTTVSPVASGTSVTLTASCASGNAVTSCAWSNNVASTTACSVAVLAQSANTSYTVTPSNSFGPGPTVSSTVQVQTGPTATNYCTGSDTIINLNWPLDGQTRPGTNGFGSQKLAFRVTVPANITTPQNINHVGFAKIVEIPGTSVTAREMTVSASPCDFQSGNYMYRDVGNSAPSTSFTANNPNNYRQAGASFNVQSGDVFYINVRNSVNGSNSCQFSTCDVYLDFATPASY